MNQPNDTPVAPQQIKPQMSIQDALDHILHPTRYVGETAAQFDYRMMQREQVIIQLAAMGQQTATNPSEIN